MKLLVVTSLAEHAHQVAEMLTRSGVKVFSRTETIGFKETHRPNLLDNWYGSSNGKYNSVFFFSFTAEENAQKMLRAIDQCNAEKKNIFPVRGFILSVESSTYIE
jgi:hypothetical protein